MRKSNKILEELIETIETANTNLDDVPYVLRAGRGMQIENARERIPQLREELKAATSPGRLIGCFASGSPEKLNEVAEFLRTENGISVDASAVYVEIAKYIEPSIGAERNFAITQYGLLRQGLSEASQLYGIQSSYPLYIEQRVETFQDLVDYVRQRAHTSCGGQLTRRSVLKAIMDAVVDNELTDRKIPVIITNTPEEDIESLTPLFSRHVFATFDDGFEVNKDSIVEALRVSTTKSSTVITNEKEE